MIETRKTTENEQYVFFDILQNDVVVGKLSVTKAYSLTSGHVDLHGWRFHFNQAGYLDLPIGGRVYAMNELMKLEDAIRHAKYIQGHVGAMISRMGYHPKTVNR